MAAGSELLCDELLRGAMPRLLRQHEEQERHAGAAGDSEADDASAPLPEPLAELLAALLHGGSLLRLSADAFEEQVLGVLAQSAPRLGARASTAATLAYVGPASIGRPPLDDR